MSSYFIAGRNKSQSKTNSSASLALGTENGDSGCIAVDTDCDSDVTIDGDPMSNPSAQNSSNSDCLWSAQLTNSEPDTHQSGPCERKRNQNDSDCGSSDRPDSFSSPISKPLQSAAGLSCTTPSGLSSTLFGSGLLSPSATTGSTLEILEQFFSILFVGKCVSFRCQIKLNKCECYIESVIHKILVYSCKFSMPVANR